MLGYSGAQELYESWRRGSGVPSDDAVVVDLKDRLDRPASPDRPASLDKGTDKGTDKGWGADVTIDLRSKGTAAALQPVMPTTSTSAATISQSDRRAVGRTLEMVSHGLDFLALFLTLVLLAAITHNPGSFKVFVFFAVVGTILLWPTMRKGRLAVPASEGLVSIVARVCLTPVVTLMIVGAVKHLIGWNYDQIQPDAIAAIVALATPMVVLGRLVSSKLMDIVRAKGYDLEDVIIVGTGPVGVKVAEALLDNPQFGLLPSGFVDRFDDELPLPLLGRPEDLREIVQATGVRHVVLAFGAADEDELVGIIRSCSDQIVQFYAVPRLFELGVSADSVGHEISGLPIVEVRRPGTAAAMWPAKRAFDLVAAGFLTLLSLPVLAVCAIGVKLSSRGPVFFRQVRIGIGGQPFEILKFRTMRVNDDSSTQWCVDDDDRVTWVGRILRPTHLDELPQLLNVLRGEMSLVGPRPERPHFVEQFSSEIDEYDYRHRVPVGITGWAQVNGYWGDTSIETRVRLDNRYIENWSLWRDLVISLRTIPTLLGRRR